MPDQAGFLQAICERPDDDTPRLVYADWPEEDGDSDRAGFIRAQCALGRLPVGDEGTRPALGAETTAKPRSHAAEWLADWPQYPQVKWDERDYWDEEGMHLLPKFLRGFPSAVIAENEAAFAGAAVELFRSAPVQELRFNNPAGELGAVPRRPEVSLLAVLGLSRFPLGEEGARRLSSEKRLSRLREARAGTARCEHPAKARGLG